MSGEEDGEWCQEVNHGEEEDVCFEAVEDAVSPGCVRENEDLDKHANGAVEGVEDSNCLGICGSDGTGEQESAEG